MNFKKFCWDIKNIMTTNTTTIIISIVTTVLTVILGWLGILVKNKILRQEKKETEKQKMKRVAFEKLLDIHSEKIQGKQYEPDWLDEFAKMCNLTIVWASDNVLSEYSLFRQKQFPEKLDKVKDYEIHFGKTVLEFRKELGYKNKNNKITPEQIVLIFKSGWKTNV